DELLAPDHVYPEPGTPEPRGPEGFKQLRGGVATKGVCLSGLPHWWCGWVCRVSAAVLLPHLRPGMSLLDRECGPGAITVDLAEFLAPREVVGVDLNSQHVERAPWRRSEV